MAKKRKNKRMRKRRWFTATERIDEGRLPALLAPDPDAERRVIEFFTAHIRNPHTLNAYARSAGGFAASWAERHGIVHLRQGEPVHVATYVGIC